MVSSVGFLTLDGDGARVKDHALDVEHVGVVCDDAGHDRNTGLNSKVESTLLERQQGGILGVAARSLGEHVDALSLVLDLLRGTLHGGSGVL